MEYSLVPVPSNPSALLGVRCRSVSPAFAGWYQRSADFYRQKTGSRVPNAIEEALAAYVEFSIKKAELAEHERTQAIREQYVDFLVDRISGMLR
jgi:hypothetical protein